MYILTKIYGNKDSEWAHDASGKTYKTSKNFATSAASAGNTKEYYLK